MSISRVQLLNELRARIDDVPKVEVSLVPALPPIHVMALSPMQQAALMQMTDSHVRRALVARLLEDSQDRPGMPEYRDLRRLGLAKWSEGKKLHDLTDAGIVAGRTLTEKLCQTYDIHLLVPNQTRDGWEVRYSCPCGFHCNVRRSPTAPGNANRMHYTHVETQKRIAGLASALTMPFRAEG